MRSLRTGAWLAALCCGILLRPAVAADIDLIDGNSVVSLNSSTGLYDWEVDGLYRLFFETWVIQEAVTDPDDRVGFYPADWSETSFTSTANTATAQYNLDLGNGSLLITLDYVLSGGPAGLAGASIQESISITNLTTAGTTPIEFALFEYTDYDLQTDAADQDWADGDVATLLNMRHWYQANGPAVAQVEVAAGSPTPDHWLAAPYGDDLFGDLLSGAVGQLGDSPAIGVPSLPPTDITFGWQWNVSLDPTDTFTLVKLKSVPRLQPQPDVPEPGTLCLLGAGLAGLAARRRRR